MEIILFLVVVAVFAGVYASKIGRSGIGWFLFALFVPFGCIIVWPILIGIEQKGAGGELRETEQRIRLLKARTELAELQKTEQ